MSCAVMTLDEHKPSNSKVVSELNDYPISPPHTNDISAASAATASASSSSASASSSSKKSSTTNTNASAVPVSTSQPNFEQQCRSLEGISKTLKNKTFEQKNTKTDKT